MSITLASELAEQAQKFWSPLGKDELFEKALLPSLVNREFQGQIKQGGDTVYVSMIQHPTAERKTIGAGADSFSSQKLTTQRVGIVADQRITAAFELEDVVDLQTQLGSPEGKSKIRDVLVQSLGKSLNSYLFSLVAPSTATPDHVLSGVATMDAAQILQIRGKAAAAQWPMDAGWWMLLESSFMNDVLSAQTLTSADYVPDAPVIGGQIANKRFGFNILEDNSAGLLSLSPAAAGAEVGLAFHPDFLYLVAGDVNFDVVPLKSNKQHGFLVVADLICGAKLGLEGALKHIQIYNT